VRSRTDDRLQKIRAAIARAVRDNDAEGERKARIELAKAKVKDLKLQVAEQLALAQVLEEDSKAS
jgi:hypothetical protein